MKDLLKEIKAIIEDPNIIAFYKGKQIISIHEYSIYENNGIPKVSPLVLEKPIIIHSSDKEMGNKWGKYDYWLTIRYLHNSKIWADELLELNKEDITYKITKEITKEIIAIRQNSCKTGK